MVSSDNASRGSPWESANWDNQSADVLQNSSHPCATFLHHSLFNYASEKCPAHLPLQLFVINEGPLLSNHCARRRRFRRLSFLVFPLFWKIIVRDRTDLKPQTHLMPPVSAHVLKVQSYQKMFMSMNRLMILKLFYNFLQSWTMLLKKQFRQFLFDWQMCFQNPSQTALSLKTLRVVLVMRAEMEQCELQMLVFSCRPKLDPSANTPALCTPSRAFRIGRKCTRVAWRCTKPRWELTSVVSPLFPLKSVLLEDEES